MDTCFHTLPHQKQRSPLQQQQFTKYVLPKKNKKVARIIQARENYSKSGKGHKNNCQIQKLEKLKHKKNLRKFAKFKQPNKKWITGA